MPGVYRDFEALTQTLRQLQEENDSAAIGLLRQIVNVKFLGDVYLLNETFPVLSHLSKAFQKGAVSFAAIEPDITFTSDRIWIATVDENQPEKNLTTFPKMIDFPNVIFNLFQILMSRD